MSASSPPSPAILASLHPSGDPATILTVTGVGDGPPVNAKADVVVLAPAIDDCGNAALRREMIGRALATLAADGVLWVDVPGRWRRTLQRELRNSGLQIGAAIVRRQRGAAHTEFALTARGVHFALANGLVSQRWRPVLAAIEYLPFGQNLIERTLPGVGFLAFRAGTRPFQWLVSAAGFDVDVAVMTSWRGDEAPFLVFALGSKATVIAKRGGPAFGDSLAYEATILRQMSEDAAESGLEVPRLILFNPSSRLSTLVETAVPGRPIAGWIGEGRHRDLFAIADRLASWLERWNSKSLRHAELTTEFAETLILSPARQLSSAIDDGGTYLEWLSREAAALIGEQVPLVAAHNDLTMTNVLGDSSAIRSVVDWEAASADGLPLADFQYAVCDAARVINGGDRVGAFRSCFMDDSEMRQGLVQSQARLRAVVDGSPHWLTLGIHATWLKHAANEQARPPSTRDASFLEIVNILAKSVAG